MGFGHKLARWGQKTLADLGYVVKRSSYGSRQDLRLVRYLELNDVDILLDVGANRGEYAASLIEAGYRGKIFSFEAIPALHKGLIDRAAATSDRWIVAPCCAVSDEEGTAEFNVTNSVSSSSLLAPDDTIKDMPGIFGIREKIEVKTTTVAAFLESQGITSNRIFLKMDIQGGERRALLGAEPVFSQIIGIVAEMPLKPHYANEATARELDAWIVERGFEIWDVEPVWRHAETGRLNYIDGTYFKPACTAENEEAS